MRYPQSSRVTDSLKKNSMNTQLVDFIVQTIHNLPLAERELVKQKLETINIDRDSTNDGELTLAERKAFLRNPLAERQAILAAQAEQIASHYHNSTEWRELMLGDIIDD
jgi:hypothetical protein